MNLPHKSTTFFDSKTSFIFFAKKKTENGIPNKNYIFQENFTLIIVHMTSVLPDLILNSKKCNVFCHLAQVLTSHVQKKAFL